MKLQLAAKTLRPKTDWVLLAAVGILLVLGSVILFAIEEGAINEVGFSPWKHILHLGVGLVLMVVAARSDFHVWFKLASWLYWISIILLVVVVFTSPTGGSSRWIELGFMQFQPSELAKLSTILLLARLFSRRKGDMSRLFNVGLSILYTAIPVALILIQPDLGTAVVFVSIWASMIMLSDIRPLYLFLAALAAFSLVVVSIPFMEAYQQQRIMTFLDPAADPQGAGYNVRQAGIAIGSGGWLGQGLDSGTQSRLAFLPAQHTDFVFAVTAEKLGFIGASAVVVLFGVVIVRLLAIALRARESFGAHIAMGIAVLFAFHVVVNVGMNLGLIPVTGLPLTFISYGGTHLVIMLLAIGIATSVARHVRGLHFNK